MIKLSCFAALILTGLGAVLSAGCAKSTAPSVEMDKIKLPGASEVMVAIEKKDYEAAVAALGKIRQSVSTEEQQGQFSLLSRQVTTKLLEAAPTDPKAAEAAQALRIMTMGR